jgi:hypothetical protein
MVLLFGSILTYILVNIFEIRIVRSLLSWLLKKAVSIETIKRRPSIVIRKFIGY